MRHFLILRDITAASPDVLRLSAVDMLIVDLGDASGVASGKGATAFIRSWRKTCPETPVAVLIPPVRHTNSDLVLSEIMPSAPDCVVLAEAQSGMDIQQVGTRMAVCEAENGLGDGATKIFAMVETAGSLFQLNSFANSGARLGGLIWSPAGVLNQLRENATGSRGMSFPFDDSVRLGRTLTLIAAANAKIPAFDATPIGLTARDAFSNARKEAERDGFSGVISDAPAFFSKIDTASRSARGG
jgi:citrate lyase subunit beta/citryl-CoA lyase